MLFFHVGSACLVIPGYSIQGHVGLTLPKDCVEGWIVCLEIRYLRRIVTERIPTSYVLKHRYEVFFRPLENFRVAVRRCRNSGSSSLWSATVPKCNCISRLAFISPDVSALRCNSTFDGDARMPS
ncbi:hypothetical protein JTB14_019306 [Gonioctena quinquepunctata]|nr:hypothetical protein JTB14_019306 [Gonioctena quinquepunctata]